jgi:hypothetical protein
MAFKMKGWSPLHQEVKPREGTVYVGPKPGDEHYQEGDEYKMSDKPMHEGQEPSTHLMADDDNLTAWPTLFQDDDGMWHEGGYEEAKKRGEVYKFNTREEMIDFARKGNWKK